jgi:hypothetical protein
MSDAQIEQEIQAKGLTAPRIKPADIQANIVDVEIVKFTSKSGQVLRWAVITAANGYAVVGKPSCSVSSLNDDQEIGEKVAIENSRQELWPLMGYELRSKLARQAEPVVTEDMVNRFLQWPVPASVHPDGTPGQPGRTGTNLLDATTARQMLEQVLSGA